MLEARDAAKMARVSIAGIKCGMQAWQHSGYAVIFFNFFLKNEVKLDGDDVLC